MKTPEDRRRWYQFSFKFLLVLITLAALLCLFWRERMLRIEAEKQAQRNAALAQKTAEKLRAEELAHEWTRVRAAKGWGEDGDGWVSGLGASVGRTVVTGTGRTRSSW